MKFNNIMLSIITLCALAITSGGLYLAYLTVNKADYQVSTTISERESRQVKPDKSSVYFGVNLRSEDLASSTKIVKERSAKILEILKKQGISEDKITTNESGYQEFDYGTGPNSTPGKVIGYTTNLSINVVFEKLDSKSTIIETIANQLTEQKLVDNYNTGSYEVGDTTEICKELIQKSNEKATAKLKEYSSKIAGFVLTKMDITDEGNCNNQQNNYPQPNYSGMAEKSIYMGENLYYNQTNIKFTYQIK
jgi:uncharacterized protein YggE